MQEGGGGWSERRKEVEGEILSAIDRRRTVYCALSASSQTENDLFFKDISRVGFKVGVKNWTKKYMSICILTT